MTIDIVVPRYHEPWETGKYLFDTIATQRGIDMENVNVILVNDGKEDILDVSKFSEYPFNIVYLVKDHEGVSAARNHGLDNSTADIVMFCDFDDGFLNNYGIHLIFSAYREGFDMLTSCFVEEVWDKEKEIMRIVRHDKDPTFIHGKAYRREFLVEKELRFDPELTIHEDAYFNNICLLEANENIRDVGTPFYLWRWNDASTVRSNPELFTMRTYPMLMKVRDHLSEEAKRRGFIDEYYTIVVKTVLDAYYDAQKPEWNRKENRGHIQQAEKHFRKYWMKYKKDFYEANANKVGEVAFASRTLAYKNGLKLEYMDVRSWLKHIERDCK